MKVIIDLLQSKKFLTLLAAVAGAIAGAVQGVIPWPDAAKGIFFAVVAYLGAQGVADGLSGGMTSSQPGTPSKEDIKKNP